MTFRAHLARLEQKAGDPGRPCPFCPPPRVVAWRWEFPDAPRPAGDWWGPNTCPRCGRAVDDQAVVEVLVTTRAQAGLFRELEAALEEAEALTPAPPSAAPPTNAAEAARAAADRLWALRRRSPRLNALLTRLGSEVVQAAQARPARGSEEGAAAKGSADVPSPGPG